MTNEKKTFAPSELIINEDGSCFHLHLKPEHLADKVIPSPREHRCRPFRHHRERSEQSRVPHHHRHL